MKTIVAKAKNIRGSAQKARIPAKIVTGMMVAEALPILEYMPKSAAKDVYKVVNSAKSNAVHNFSLEESDLYIKNVRVDKSISYRRMKAGSRGGANFFNKHFCHITVELGLVSEKDMPEAVVKADKKVEEKTETKPKAEKKAAVKPKKTKIAEKKTTAKKSAKADAKK